MDLDNIVPLFLDNDEIYTRYTASDGLSKITKITTWGASSSGRELNGCDKSVFEARWLGVEDLACNTEWAPANLVILGKYLQFKNLCKNLPENVMAAIDKANAFCLNLRQEIQGY